MSKSDSASIRKGYFPPILQNGVDSMLIGLLGSPDGAWEYSQHLSRQSTVGWYKTDRRENPLDCDLIELANLSVRPCIGKEEIVIADSHQEFDARNAVLTTEYWQKDNRRAGHLRVRVTTFLTKDHVLVERYELLEVPQQGASFKFSVGPSVQPANTQQVGSSYFDPMKGWQLFEDAQRNGVGFIYHTGVYKGIGLTWTDLEGTAVIPGWGQGKTFVGVRLPITIKTPEIFEPVSFTRYTCLVDNVDSGEISPEQKLHEIWDKVVDLQYDQLLAEHSAYWRNYNSVSSISLPGREDIEKIYDFSNYCIKATQEKSTGFTPVGIQPFLWNGYQFWDSSFFQYAWLSGNHIEESEKFCRFLISRHSDASDLARKMGAPGARMAWRTGRDRFEIFAENVKQYHNNSAAAYCLYLHYLVSGDKDLLEESFPMMDDLVIFMVHETVKDCGDYAVIGECMGPDESFLDLKVNDSWTCAITIKAIECLTESARVLGKTPTVNGLPGLAVKLRRGLDMNVDKDGVLQPFQGAAFPHWGSLIFSHCPEHSALLPTIDKMEECYDPVLGLYNSHGLTRYAEKSFPWADFWKAHILAMACDSRAGERIEKHIPYTNKFGGIAERIFYHGERYKEYFGTGHAAFCWALNCCMVNQVGDELRLFPGIPESWGDVSFENLRTESGLLVSASLSEGRVTRLDITSRIDGLRLKLVSPDNSLPDQLIIKEGKISYLEADRVLLST